MGITLLQAAAASSSSRGGLYIAGFPGTGEQNEGTMAVFVFVWSHSCCCCILHLTRPTRPPGKTATVHHVLGRLRRERKDLPFTHIEVNGLTLSTPAQVTRLA